MMRQAVETMTVRTRGRGFYEFTREIQSRVQQAEIQTGLCTLHLQHTSASLLIQENAAPAARRDLEAYFRRIAPESSTYEHDDEGPDDMPAHLRTALTQSQLSIPVGGGRMLLGTWQGIYLFEHRSEPPVREIALHLIGE